MDAQYGEVIGAESTCKYRRGCVSGNNCNNLKVIKATADATSGAVTLFHGKAQSPAAQGINLQFNTALTTSCATSGSQCGSVFIANSPNGNFSIDGGMNVNTSGNINANGNATVNGSLTVNGGINGTLNNLNISNLNLATATITNLTVPGGIATNNIGVIGSQGSTLTIPAGNTSFGGAVSIPSGALTVSGHGKLWRAFECHQRVKCQRRGRPDH